MALSTGNSPQAFLPDDFGSLLIATATPMSFALNHLRVETTRSGRFHIPTITNEVSAAWVGELEEISLTDATLGEEVVELRKVAALSKVSNEMLQSASENMNEVIGQSLARSLANKLDEALFSTQAGNSTEPKGIGSFGDGDLTTVKAGAAWTNVDPFTEAVFALEDVGANLSVFVANPVDAKELAQLKKETGSNEPLLSVNANVAATRSLAGVPLVTSRYVPAGTIYGLDATRVYTILNQAIDVQRDESTYFTSYATALRGVARVGYGYPHPKAIARIKLDG